MGIAPFTDWIGNIVVSFKTTTKNTFCFTINILTRSPWVQTCVTVLHIYSVSALIEIVF